MVESTSRLGPVGQGQIQWGTALSTLAVFLWASPCAAEAKPVVMPELSFGRVTATTSASFKDVPSVAFDGSIYFVVWEDEREGGQIPHVYGARVSQDGEVLDRTALRLGDGFAGQANAAVAFGDGVFLVVWTGYYQQLQAVRVDSAGTKLDPQPLQLAPHVGVRTEPRSVAYDGERFLVVETQLLPSKENLVAWWVRPDGEVDGMLTVADGPGNHSAGRVACLAPSSGRTCLVVWNEVQGGDTDVYTRLLSAGASSGPAFAIVDAAGWQGDTALTSHKGSEFFVAWSDQRVRPWTVRGVRVTAAGAVPKPSGINLGNPTWDAAAPSVASDGQGIVVGYNGKDTYENSSVRLARLDDSDLISPVEGFGVGTEGEDSHQVVLAWGQASGLAIWDQYRDGVHGLYANVVPLVLSADLPAGTPISLSVNEQVSPSLASSGEGSLVVWEDWTAGQSDLFMARISRDGEVLDPQGIALSTDPRSQRSPAVAWTGAAWLVAWIDENRPFPTVIARRVSADGALLDTNVITVAPSNEYQGNPRLAVSANTALVVFEESRTGHDYNAVLGVRLSPSGALMDAQPLVLAGDPVGHRHTAVSTAGDGFVVAWLSVIGRDEFVMRAAGLTSGGLRSGSAEGSDLFPSSFGTDYPGSIACTATECLALWSGSDILARPTRLDGTPKGRSFLVRAGPFWGSSRGSRQTTVAALGGMFLAAWPEGKSEIIQEVRGSRLLADGTLVDPETLLLTPGTFGNAESPALVAASNGTLLLGYSAFDLRPSMHAMRAHVRHILTEGTAGAGDGGSTLPDRFGITSTPTSFLECDEAFRYSASGVPTATGPGPIEWSVEALNEPLPPGLQLDADTGELSWRPSQAAEGKHQLTLVARGTGWSARQPLTLEVRCSTKRLNVGLGCSTVRTAPEVSPLAGLLGLLAGPLALMAAQARRARARARREGTR